MKIARARTQQKKKHSMSSNAYLAEYQTVAHSLFKCDRELEKSRSYNCFVVDKIINIE